MKEKFITYLLNNMSLSDKIGQMIMMDFRNTTEMTAQLEDILTKYNPGGFILFHSNIADYKQTQKFLNEIKSVTNIKGMVSADQEGGRVQRLGSRVGFEEYPPMGVIGATMDPSIAFELGKKMGRELKEIGVDMDMAPVLDIFSNPENKVIADRAFGTNSEVVKKMSMAYAEGLKKSDVIAVGKHFPGHGDTFKDSHVDLPIVEKSLEELKELELLPFIEAIDKKLPGIMVGHLAVPKITGDNLPASLSPIMINELLKKKLGYNGIVMPDSIKMKALSKYFTSEEIYLRCINAGNDIMLMPQNIKDAFETIYRKVNEGIISEDRINNSVYKILSLKCDYGLLNKEYNEYKNHNIEEKKHTI